MLDFGKYKRQFGNYEVLDFVERAAKTLSYHYHLPSHSFNMATISSRPSS